MGILKRHLYLLAIENKKHPIRGDVLTLGQQSIHATLDEVKTLFEKNGVISKKLPENFDTKNKIPGWKETGYQNYTNCQAVLRLLGAKKVFSADISSYENPEILMDFNAPVDKKYYNRFDTILDIGTLEHVFNIPQAFENIKLMLKPGGTVILGYPLAGTINHGFYQICPTLLYDYFSTNGFENFDFFILNGSNINYEKKAKIYQCKQPAFTENLIINSKTGLEVTFFATKSANKNGPVQKIPVQTEYTTSSYWQNKQNQTITKKQNLLLQLLFVSRKWRPEFIDRIWKKIKTKKMLIYLGKY
jgi:hypothetical protein